MDPYHETYQGLPAENENSQEIPLAKLIQYQKQHREGANWFYWIAGLSVLSAVLMGIGSSIVSAISLGSIEFLIALASQVPELSTVAILAGVLIIGIFAGLGFLSNKEHLWAYITGIILFLLDTALLVWVMDFIGIAIHALALYYLIVGCIALKKLKSIAPPQ